MPWARDGSKMHPFPSSLGGGVEKTRKVISTAERLAFSIIISCFSLPLCIHLEKPTCVPTFFSPQGQSLAIV